MSVLAVIVISYNEKRVLQAIRSLVTEKNREDVGLVYLVDNGTTSREARQKLRQARNVLMCTHTPHVFVRNESHVSVSEVRRRAYDEILKNRSVDLITCLDADDRVGQGAFAAFHQAFHVAGGVADVIVPRYISVIQHEGLELSVRQLHIPQERSECPDLSQIAGAWALLTSVGASFAVSTRAAMTYGHFSEDDEHDEWVRMLCRWAHQGARFVYANVEGKGYCYYQHPQTHHASGRRRQHAQTRVQIAETIFRS